MPTLPGEGSEHRYLHGSEVAAWYLGMWKVVSHCLVAHPLDHVCHLPGAA